MQKHHGYQKSLPQNNNTADKHYIEYSTFFIVAVSVLLLRRSSTLATESAAAKTATSN